MDESKKYLRTYAKIDLDAIKENIANVSKKIKAGTKIMAIVKANAYGHGAVEVSKALYEQVDAYGVATIDEAIELRENEIDKIILILGYTPSERFDEIINYDISQTVYTLDMAKCLNDAAQKLDKIAKVHIKLDTSMGRIGFKPIKENVEVIKEISNMKNIMIEGMFTHFARADEETADAAREPFEKYMNFANWLEECGINIPIKHVSNSASIMAFPEANLDMVRSGITTYGIYPSDEVDRSLLDLKPGMEWKAHVSFVKDIDTGTPISYGGTFAADKPMKIATIPVGYADGMKRSLSNKGRVIINGEYAPILGRVCMDQFMVDVTNIADVKIGDEVTIFGKDKDKEITIEEISYLGESFPYEFVCSVTSRVPRKY